MKPFINVAQACQHFRNLEKNKKGSADGVKVVLTGGPEDSERCRDQFKARGIAVSVAGDHGDREIAFKKFNDHIPKYQKEYKRSKAEKEDFLWRNRMSLLQPDGHPVYIEGNQTTLTRSLRKAGYTGYYSIWKAAGWMVKIHKIPAATKDDLEKKALQAFIKSKDMLVRFKVGKVRTGNFIGKNTKDFHGVIGYQETKGAIEVFVLDVPNLDDLARKYALLLSLRGETSMTSEELFKQLRGA